MSQNAAPQSGDLYLQFNGIDAYVEIPSIADYSLATTGALTVAAWVRPDTLNFPSVEPDSDYIHWLGKGDQSGSEGNQEWTFRMYNYRTPLESPPRPNRISFYVFNPQGGLGVGSYVQVKVAKGRWMHVVGMADDKCTYFYEAGQYVRCSTYRGPAQGECEIQEQNGTQVVIHPQPGSAALRLAWISQRGRHLFCERGCQRLLSACEGRHPGLWGYFSFVAHASPEVMSFPPCGWEKACVG